ncbi:MAG: pyridoxal phosphate-dependent aminotransferase [Coriobacteriia bacterium]|nr:pyridoxal phosphate-dependent aminotransferase [Coriobacteriia bacterium]
MLSQRMQNIAGLVSPIRAAFEEGQRLAAIHGAENVFDFSIGNPEMPAPPAVAQAAADVLAQDPLSIHGYMADAGYDHVRAAVAADLNRRYGTAFAARNVVMTVGAAGAMNIAMYALMDPGDEVLVMAPYYPGYTSFVTNWNGTLVAVDPDPATFQPDLADLERKITPRTKVVIVNSPNNPSGAIYSKQTAAAIGKILGEKERQYGHAIYLISDEPYRDLLYVDADLPSWTDCHPNTFLAYSFSKSLSLPGERIGYLVVPDAMEQSADVLHAVRTAQGMLGFVNAPSTYQHVVARCLDCTVDLEPYRQNRSTLLTHLQQLGFQVQEPQGAFYLFVKAPGAASPQANEDALLEAARANNVLLVGGSAFGCPGYARISFCVSPDKVRRSLPAFTAIANALIN